MRYHTFYSRDEMQKMIESPEGYKVGWELHKDLDKGLVWRWARVVFDNQGEVLRCETIREASQEEARRLSHLLKGDIACRYQKVQSGNPWAFASID